MIFRAGDHKNRQDRIGSIPENERRQSERLKTATSEALLKRKPRNDAPAARFVSIVSTLIFAAGLFLYFRFPLFFVSEVKIYGHENINAEELIYYTGMKNRPIAFADPSAIERNVFRRYPENRAISVHAKLPNRLDIFFEQRVAAVEWNFGGDRFWMDESGYVFRENLSASPETVVYANSFPGAMNRNDRSVPTKFRQDIVEAALRIFTVKPAGTRLNFTYDNGYGWDSGKGYMLWIGVDDSELDVKMAMFESLDRYFKANEIEPGMVSLEFTNAPYYRYAD